jgi:hypothetical protein
MEAGGSFVATVSSFPVCTKLLKNLVVSLPTSGLSVTVKAKVRAVMAGSIVTIKPYSVTTDRFYFSKFPILLAFRCAGCILNQFTTKERSNENRIQNTWHEAL